MKSQTISNNQLSTCTSVSNLDKLENIIKFAKENKLDNLQILELIKLTFDLSNKINFNIPTQWFEYSKPMAPIIPYNPTYPSWENPVIWCSQNVNNKK